MLSTGTNIHDLRNDSHQELRTERVNQALNPNPQFYNISQSDHDMETMHSLSPSEDTEMRDDMSVRPKTTYLPSLGSNQAMSDNVANQSSAVADHTGESERQKQIAENELRQQEIRQSQQLENVRQQAASVLQATTQELTESHRAEAIAAIIHAASLTEKKAFTKFSKQNQEIQQMAANDERSRQTITALRNQIRNQEKEQEPPKRANPKAKIEPKPKTTAIEDDDNPEANHPPKGKRGRPSNNTKFVKKYQEQHDDNTVEKNKKPDHDTEKDMNRTRTHWRQATRGYLVDQLSKHGWKWPKSSDGKNAKLLKPALYKIMIELLGI